MSALGQKRTWRDVRRMSALPPRADGHARSRTKEPNVLSDKHSGFESSLEHQIGAKDR